MIPISFAKKLPEGLNISPFDIYIIVSEDEIEKASSIINKIWDIHPVIKEFFKVKYITLEDLCLEDNDFYFYRVFEKTNIFARVMMPPREYIKLEICNYKIKYNDPKDIETVILTFLIQLCTTDLDEIDQVLLDTEFFGKHEDFKIERIELIVKVKHAFHDLVNYLRQCLLNSRRYFLRHPQFFSNRYEIKKNDRPEYLNENFKEKLQILREVNGEMDNIRTLSSAVGIDIPEFIKDPSITIEICEDSDGKNYPGLLINRNDKSARTRKGYKEGIFIYACTMLNYIEDKEFSKQDFYKFLNEIEPYKNLKKEEYDENVPKNILKVYNRYKKIYEALFLRKLNKNDISKIKILGGQTFNFWCKELLQKKKIRQKDPFYQGIANIRAEIKDSLKENGLGYIFYKVNLNPEGTRRGKPYKIYVNKENIFFPDNDRWRELVDESNIKIRKDFENLNE